MKVVKELDLFKHDGLIYSVRRIDREFIELCKMLSEEDCIDLVNYLNTIANQGISSFCVKSLTYVRDDKTLSLYDLSSGEWVFMIAWLARKCRVSVVLARCIKHINPMSMQKFVEDNRDNEFLIILTENDEYFYNIVSYYLEDSL